MPDIGLQHPYIEETETMTEKYGNREMHPHLSELESNTSPQHSVSDEYSANADPATHTETGYASKKIDFSGMELSYLSDSELEDLLSGRHSKEETKAVGEKSEKSNSSMQEKEALDPASDNKEDNGDDDDDDDDDNATERGGDGKTDSEYYKKETRPSGIEVFRPNLDDANELNDADHQRGITHWLKEGLSDKDFLTMLALYNSIDSSETEETGEEHSDFTNGNSSRQTEETPPIPNETEHEMGNADSNEHKGLFEFLHENSSHPNEPNVYSADTETSPSNTTPTEADIGVYPPSVSHDTERDTGQGAPETGITNYDVSRLYEKQTTAPEAFSSSSESSPDDHSSTTKPINTNDTVNPGIELSIC